MVNSGVCNRSFTCTKMKHTLASRLCDTLKIRCVAEFLMEISS